MEIQPRRPKLTSSDFAARCYASAAPCRHAVSVCPSVTFVDSVKTSNRIFKIFFHRPSGSQAILVVIIPNVMAIFWRGRH